MENTGTEEQIFLPRILRNSDINVKIVYKNNEYQSSELAGSTDDLNVKTFKPSYSQTGIIVFEVPDEVADNYKDSELMFTCGDDIYSFSIK